MIRYLIRVGDLDVVALEDVVQARVQLLQHVLDEQRAAQAEAILQVVPEVLVVQRGYLQERDVCVTWFRSRLTPLQSTGCACAAWAPAGRTPSPCS